MVTGRWIESSHVSVPGIKHEFDYHLFMAEQFIEIQHSTAN